MTYVQRVSIDLTCDSNGASTAFSSGIAYGLVYATVLQVGTLSTARGITVSGERSGLGIWAESTNSSAAAVVRFPRMATHTTAGADALYAAGGTGVLEMVPVAAERVKVVVSSGGTAGTTGQLHLYLV